jgi:hypothetical protein
MRIDRARSLLQRLLPAMALLILFTARGSARYTAVEVTSGAAIRGRVMWEGDIPELEDFEVHVSRQFCALSGKKPCDLLEVDPVTLGIADTVVYLSDIERGEPAGTMLKDGQAPLIRLAGCAFSPRMIVVPVSKRFYILNDDPVVHRVRLTDNHNVSTSYEFPLQGGDKIIKINREGFLAVTCARHPWETATIVIAGHPYYAVTDKTGAFLLEKIPPGRYTLVAWHNGIRARPVSRGDIKTHRYRFSDPLTFEQSVEVEAEETAEVEILLSEPDD